MKRIFYQSCLYAHSAVAYALSILVFLPAAASAQLGPLASHTPGHFNGGTPDQLDSGGSHATIYNHPADDFSGEGRPTNRRSGGLRSGTADEDPCLHQVIALVPGLGDVNDLAENCTVPPTESEAFLARTAVDSPRLWFYVASATPPELMAELVLLDDENQFVTMQQVPLSSTPGVISVQLDYNLEPNRPYRWIFSVQTHEQATRNSEVEGWVRWVSPEAGSELSRQLAAAPPQARAAIYAAEGYWHDALTALAERRQREPDTPSINADWSSLLNQVGLGAIAPIPLVDCCQAGEIAPD
ncbi:MAG: DUF928 domain-containing protein [Cyanobacteria bacterium P01_A01_bin.114]